MHVPIHLMYVLWRCSDNTMMFWGTYRMYMITPRDQMSHDLSYFSGPRTSGAVEKKELSSTILFLWPPSLPSSLVLHGLSHSIWWKSSNYQNLLTLWHNRNFMGRPGQSTWAFSTYQHSRVCSRVSGGCPWCGSPWQTQSQSASAPPCCLQQNSHFPLNIYNDQYWELESW